MTHRRLAPLVTIAALASLVLAAPSPAQANERHFAFTYESPTLPAGAVELEPWTTWRFGRDRYYSRFDHRLEFEVGLVDRLQTSLYVNFTGLTENDGTTLRHSEFEYEGVSSEWKLNLRDPVADSFGLALYGELTLAPTETEIETKLILDKRSGNLMLAANLVGELELEQEVTGNEVETEPEMVVEVDLAAGVFIRPRLLLGVELRNHTELPEGEFEHSAFFLGPVLSYGAQDYWVAVSVQPQIFALKNENPNDTLLELDHHEKLNARVLFGFHL